VDGKSQGGQLRGLVGVRPCGELQTSRPAGWRDTDNTQPHPGPIIDAIEEKEMIPGGQNRQRKASNTH
jgi:hypothetical protein